LHERAGHFDIAAEHYTARQPGRVAPPSATTSPNKRPDCAAGDRDGFRDSAGHGVRVVTLVDGVHQNLGGFVEDFVTEPTTMPWGNRSLLFRDPDGNLVNFFTPVTPAALAKFAR
jgi:hypothetical protein